ncbi:uncharacterized protein E5676_scaffold208G001130 [Cucumis melo var. makuwa]|uniref:Uncharacterized protein n=1 Tax=Cucumis melo var. makuwa TaxID=1194695 RepID=A0A5D3E3H8_CUCMM|nr:uncharacterized protein E5676_scaffold208G001130 [Cucumis melo var. makuwa]
MSRKGFAKLAKEMKASTSSGGLIDRSLVWKKARTTKDGEISNTDTKKVANKITYYRKSLEGMIHREGFEGCVNMSHRVNNSTLQERNERRVPKVATKGETTDESKIKSQMASKSIDTLNDANDHDTEEENIQVLEEEVEIEDLTIEKQDKVGDENKDVCVSTGTSAKVKDGTSYRLAIGTKDNVVGVGTIFDYDIDGDNMKVSVDMVVDGNCFIPVPTREGMTMLSQEVGS